MKNCSVRVGVVQQATTGARADNVARATEGIAEAAGRGAQLVVLQELFASPYFCQVEDAAIFDWAEPLDGDTPRAIAAAAAQREVWVLGSFFERRAAGIYHNTAVLMSPAGDQVLVYRKMHIPDDPQYYEKFYFTPGDLGFLSAQAGRVRVGPLVCWDQWFPEAARLTALAGAQMLLYPTAIGWLPADREALGDAQRDAWKTIQRSHAIANGVFVVAANRVGVERSGEHSIEFWGNSFLVDPQGRVIAEAGSAEEVLVADCDIALIEEVRRGWPFFRDRRIDAYQGLLERWGGSR